MRKYGFDGMLKDMITYSDLRQEQKQHHSTSRVELSRRVWVG